MNLITLKDVLDFAQKVSEIDGDVFLTDSSNGYRINAKSILGIAATIEWHDVWIESENEAIYNAVKDYIE